jgi:hypothetical protein
MKTDKINRVDIDEAGCLHVVPATHSFPYIYREAMEIQWDPARGSLYAPAQREWSKRRWLQQILAAAKQQGCELHFTQETQWGEVDPELNDLTMESES